MRNGLLTKHERLLRLEKATAEQNIELTQEQVLWLERFSPEFRERHIEAPHTGSLVAVDTFFVGVLKGVGKIYLQTAIDCHSRYAWAKHYPAKPPITAVHLMNNDVIPTFEAANARIDVVFSANGREFCGRPDQHPYELFLLPPHALGRALPGRRAQDLVRDHRGNARYRSAKFNGLLTNDFLFGVILNNVTTATANSPA